MSCDKSIDPTNSSVRKEKSLIARADNYNLSKEGQVKYLDSAARYLPEAAKDTVTQGLLKKITIGYYNRDLYEKAISSGKQLHAISVSLKDTLATGRALFYIGESFYGLEENDSALRYYSRAEKINTAFKGTGDKALGEIILYKAYIYYDAGEFVLCEAEAFKAEKHLRIANKATDLYNCYNLIASSLDGQENEKDAIDYYQRAFDVIDNFKKEGYSESQMALYKASCYNNMGGVYVKMKQHKKAIEIYQQALSMSEADSPGLYAKLLNNLASAKYKSGDFSQLPELFYKSLAIRDSLQNERGIVASNVSLGEYFLYRKDTAKAISYLTNAYHKAKEIKSNSDILSTLKTLSAIDKVSNDYYIRRYVTVNDSLQKIAQNTRNKFARIEFDTDRILTEKDALAKKNSFIIGVSIVVVLFIAAIFIIYYLNSKNKELLLVQEQQKANEEIYELMFEQQGKIESAKTEEKSRIAMELHDGILNNIYAVRLNLEFINKKADDESIVRRKEYIKELQNIESEIRGVSHDLSRNALFNQEQSFENMLGFMITSQKNNFDTEFEAEIDPLINWEEMSNVRKVNVYRIIQEALQNINKYSSAGHAKVVVTRNNENIVVTITDDGIGFVPEKAKGGIGLRNLKKRADALGGALQINSKPGKGAVVEVLFPM
ncbi:tetratricopeptide repeat-containing sensor histidine kinase [Flavobacterium hauense]